MNCNLNLSYMFSFMVSALLMFYIALAPSLIVLVPGFASRQARARLCLLFGALKVILGLRSKKVSMISWCLYDFHG